MIGCNADVRAPLVRRQNNSIEQESVKANGLRRLLRLLYFVGGVGRALALCVHMASNESAKIC